MNGARDTLARGAVAILDRSLSPIEGDAFFKYLNLLVKWNRTQRLIGSTEPGWIVENLFLHSLLFLKILPAQLGALLDLGSGAGLPGIPLKIVRRETELVLVEARERRASFLSIAVRELALERASVVRGRAEEFAGDFAGRFDAVVMRCAGDVAKLFPLAAQFVRVGGLVVASGPPRERPLSVGQWVTVTAWGAGMTRRFAVYRRT